MIKKGFHGLPKITKKLVENACALEPRRIIFKINNPLKTNFMGEKNFFKVKFKETIKLVLTKTFPNIHIIDDQKGHGCYFHTKDHLDNVEKWVLKNQDMVFIRDCLMASVALELLNNSESQKKSILGEHFFKAKNHQERDSINFIADAMVSCIENNNVYKKIPNICAVPCNADNEFDLARELAKIISHKLQKINISHLFHLTNKPPLKAEKIADKWDIWEKSDCAFNITNEFTKNSVIIIDDCYQSGITMNFIAMKLQESGFINICGLSALSAMRNRDNQKDRISG